jgi:Flp pilus assembly protein TadG
MKRAIKFLFGDRWRGQKGAVAVEMAIVLPLFAVLLTGTFEFGQMAQQHQILQNAAREGARFSGLPAQQGVVTAVQDRVIAYLANEGITVVRGDIDVNQGFKVTAGADTISCSNVTISYRRPILLNSSTTFFGLGPIVLQGNAVFRNFY